MEDIEFYYYLLTIGAVIGVFTIAITRIKNKNNDTN